MIGRIIRAVRPWPKHPIDRLYGIETSRKMWRLFLRTGNARSDQESIGYSSAQPSIIRQSLETIPDIDGSIFVDVGCGKGRVLAVATEYSFSEIRGIELSPSLARIALENGNKISRLHPNRILPSVSISDACDIQLDDSGVVVIFLYNPFQESIMTEFVGKMKASLNAKRDLKLYVVYYNPVHHNLLDECKEFSRFHARRYEFSEEERDTSPFGNQHDSVVIWQSTGGHRKEAHPSAGAMIRVLIPNLAAAVY